MVQPSRTGMKLPEFLEWDDGTDTRYELFRGAPVAMAPPSRAHGRITGNLARLIGNQLQPPCGLETEVGIAAPDRDDTCYQPDLVVSCSEASRTALLVEDPEVILEVLSPTTSSTDLLQKVPDYQRIRSVRAILLVSSFSMSIEIRRRSAGAWVVESAREPDAEVVLESIGARLRVRDVYAGTDVRADRTGAP